MLDVDATDRTGLSRLDGSRGFRRAVVLCCLLFLTLQVLYISRLPLVMDEFQHAASVYRLAESTPYRDFRPYKTVLGYYVQLPVLLAATRPWEALLAVKLEMAIVAAVALAALALALRRHFSARAILLGLGMLMMMSTFAERASELRVDMLTAVAGLASLLLLLSGRYALAGLACGTSLLLSQKAAYYVIAANLALAVVWVFHHRSLRRLRPAVAFNALTASILLAYLLFWATVSSWTDVFQATFLSHGGIAFGQLYDNQLKYWSQTVSRNPFFYLVALFGLKSLVLRRSPTMGRERQILLATYGAVLIALSALHRQPWPYFFVLLIPTLAILVIACLDDEIRRWSDRSKAYRHVVVIGLVTLGFALPASRIADVIRRDSSHQRSMVLLADALLQPGEAYLAGTQMIFDRPQAVQRLAWLDIPTARAIYELPVYEKEELRRHFAASATKIVINNYRLYRLPRLLRLHLERTYMPFWGSIAIYAPAVDAGEQTVDVRFAGQYEILGPSSTLTTIDGRQYEAGATLYLARGLHTVVASTEHRLRYVPEGIDDYLDPDHRNARSFFPQVYTY